PKAASRPSIQAAPTLITPKTRILRGPPRFENAHRILCREVCYRLHPWFGRKVFVHAAIDKVDGAVFQCSVDGSDAERWLEISAWMFDHGAYAGDRSFSAAPFICLEALGALSSLLDQVLKTTSGSSNAQLSDASGISHDQNRGDNHRAEVHGGGDRASAQAAPRSTMVWSAPTTDARLKKRIVRTLIHEVVADINDDASEIVIVVHWTGGVHSEIRLPKRRRGQRNSTSADIIAVAQLG
ncbi:MAG: hypothetical protein WB816_16245, partial [Methylocystis sp.]